MTAFKFDSFGGLYPRIPDSHLPPTAATVADNCDFGYDELRNAKGGFLIQSLSNTPTSLYTDDGLKFYSWTSDVNAVRSPLSRDTFNRLYYTGNGDFRVTSRDGMSGNGGQPSSSYRVGVPKPTIAPALAVPSIPTLTNSTMTAKFHYEYGGIKYQEQAIALTIVTANTKWTFTPPAKSTGASTSTVYQFGATAYYIPEHDVGDQTIAEQWVSLPASTTITPISNSAITTNAGATYSTTKVKDVAGMIHEVETLLSLSQYSLLKASGTTSNSATATPDQAVPVIRLTAVDNATGAALFDIYSANSGLGPSDLFELSITKDVAPALTYTLILNAGVKESSKETRAYIYTYVNTYGEEGPPSPPATVTTSPTLDVTVTATRDAQTGVYAPIKEIRIYRTPTGSEVADYFYVGAISVLTANGTTFPFSDNVKASGLNEPIASTYYYPPDPALVGLLALPNGILMAWKGNELHFSDAYKPWSWPPSYVKTFPVSIVGAIAVGSGALVTTIAQPFLIAGVSPDSMTERKIDSEQAGVSKWSMASVGGMVAYASNDGIVVLEGGQATLSYSEQFFTRDVWRGIGRIGLTSMRFAVWDGRLVVYSGQGAFVPFMIRLDEEKGAMARLPAFFAKCTFVSPVSDQFYSVVGNQLYQFAGGSDIAATWQSREMVFNAPVNFGFAQAVCTGSWTIIFYAAGALKHVQTLAAGTTNFRLPSGFKEDRWQIQIAGTGRFRELRVAETARELAKL